VVDNGLSVQDNTTGGIVVGVLILIFRTAERYDLGFTAVMSGMDTA